MHRVVAVLVACLLGCAGPRSSSEPFYPADWPPLVAGDGARGRVELTGTYRAVSDPAGPLEYPAGGHPRETFFFVPFGPPLPAPPLGRRVLPWHLAAAQGPADRSLWSGLERFAAALRPDPDHPEGREDLGLVEVSEGAAGRLEVRCSVGQEALLCFELGPSPERTAWEALWTLPRGYTLRDGGLVVHGAFPASPLESRAGPEGVAAGTFTFFRAVDGSLVMLESPNVAPEGGEVVFRKWWRWRPVR